MESGKKYPVSISPVAARHLLTAMSEEIDRLNAIASSLGENDAWPDDYDPNDLALYRRWAQWLENASSTGGELADPATKSVEFLMTWLPLYARNKRDVIPPADMEVLFRTYAEYVASYCASSLPEELVRQTSRSAWMHRNLLALLNFPRSR
jgi:hypothetical protein